MAVKRKRQDDQHGESDGAEVPTRNSLPEGAGPGSCSHGVDVSDPNGSKTALMFSVKEAARRVRGEDAAEVLSTTNATVDSEHDLVVAEEMLTMPDGRHELVLSLTSPKIAMTDATPQIPSGGDRRSHSSTDYARSFSREERRNSGTNKGIENHTDLSDTDPLSTRAIDGQSQEATDSEEAKD
eukprot:Clim_evm35s201 gene=Clim_evmTU35s201